MLKHYKNILYPLIISLLFIFLFIGVHQISYIIALFIIVSIVISIINNKLNYYYNKSLLLILLFFITHIIGIFYSTNKDIATFDIEIKLSLFIFPLLFLFISNLAQNKYNIILNIYFSAASFFSIFLISRLVYKLLIGISFNKLMYTNYSYFLHPSYYAMYSVFAIIIGISLIKNKNKLHKILLSLLILFNIISIFFSDSKSGIISLIIVLFFIFIKYVYNKSKSITILSLLLLIIAFIVTINTNSRMRTMFNVTTNYSKILNNPNDYKESTGLRILSWYATTQTIKKNPIVGVGTGDIKQELFIKYKELNFNKTLEIKMNVHNQFLETWLGQGIIGLFILLLMFIIPFIKAIKNKDLLLQGFLIIVFLNFLFESMLNTQAGTIFFAFFYSLLVSKNKSIS